MAPTTPPGANGRLVVPRSKPKKSKKDREETKNKNAMVRAKNRLGEDKWLPSPRAVQTIRRFHGRYGP